MATNAAIQSVLSGLEKVGVFIEYCALVARKCVRYLCERELRGRETDGKQGMKTVAGATAYVFCIHPLLPISFSPSQFSLTHKYLTHLRATNDLHNDSRQSLARFPCTRSDADIVSAWCQHACGCCICMACVWVLYLHGMLTWYVHGMRVGAVACHSGIHSSSSTRWSPLPYRAVACHSHSQQHSLQSPEISLARSSVSDDSVALLVDAIVTHDLRRCVRCPVAIFTRLPV